jgi:hypothetical protein
MRKFYGNQYIGKTWRTFKLVLSGTWIGIKEIFHNPKVLLGILMLGLALATLVQTSTPHRFMIADAWADLTSEDQIKYVREVVETLEEPAVIMERIAKCESGGSHYRNNRVVMNLKNTNGTFDVGKFQINSEWEVTARKMGYDIFTPEGNESFAYWLYDTRGTEDWYSSKHCWAK